MKKKPDTKDCILYDDHILNDSIFLLSELAEREYGNFSGGDGAGPVPWV